MNPIGVYAHVPFCLRKCPYCDFYSLPCPGGAGQAADTYTEALLRAIAAHPFGPLRADTLYFGGGTPFLLGAKRIGRIVEAARKAFGLSGAEITLEVNPAAALDEELRAMRQAGVNRLSFGVQSLVDSELRALGRAHGAAEAEAALCAAADAGFENLSADLMLAIPGQTRASLAETLNRLVALPLRHVSAYLLKVEEGTAFSAMYGGGKTQNGAPPLPNDDETARLYLDCVEGLEKRGFVQYEISNFTRAGGESRHNLKYWRCGEYLGLGPSAHSFLHGKRFYLPRDLAGFVAAERPLDLAVPDGDGGSFSERAMLSLRLTEGFACDASPEAQRLLARARRLEPHGLLRIQGDTVSLTPEGFLLSNAVTAELLQDC